MRKLIFVFIALIAISSCKKDDSANSVQPTLTIIGKWDVEKYQEIFNSSVGYSYTGKPGDYVEFKTNKTYVISADNSIDSGMYELNGNILTFDTVDIWDITYHTTNKLIFEATESTSSGTERFIFYLKR